MRYRKAPQNYEDWLQDRKDNPSIGASQSASILGLNPYSSAVDEYLKLTSGIDITKENLAMRLGREMEPILRKLFMEETGLNVKQDNKVRIHEEHDFITTNLDGMVVGEKVPVEYKTTAQPWDGEIPDHYFVQIQHQMMVTESPYMYFASLSLGFNKQLVIEKYERNDEFISDMEKKLIDFWENNVMKAVPPEPQSVEDAQKIFREIDPDSIRDADESIYYICRKLQNLNSDKRTIDDRIKEHKLELMKTLSNKQVLQYNGTTLVTWKQNKDSSIFNKDQFREDHPKLFNKYTRTRAGSRRFVLKKIEEI